MSFALTTDQVRRREKTVTRRLGSQTAKAGEVRQPIVKGQGIPKGGKVERINGPIRFVDVRREKLVAMLLDPEYGKAECRREGFPDLSPWQFVEMFCQHNGCDQYDEVTRIEFEYI